MVGTSIFGIVVNKLCYRKKPCPIILIKVDKSSEIGFHHAILFFGLTVCLWIEGDRKSLLDTKEII